METIEKIKELCKGRGISLKALERELGFGNGSLAKAKSIKLERLQDIANYFDVSLEFFMDEKEECEQMPVETARLVARNMQNKIDYYTDPATLEVVQKLFESPGRRALFDAVADLDEESIQKYADFIERITNDNNKGN